MKRILIITNIISPYRIPLFNVISKKLDQEGMALRVLFLTNTEPDRDWNIEYENIAFDFRILLMTAINKENLLTLMYLENGIKNLIKYFTPEFNKMVNKEVMWDDSDSLIQFNKLHIMSSEIMEQICFKNNLEETYYIFMNIETFEELMRIYY